MLRRLLERLAARLPPPRVIFDRAGISPYLSRYYLLGAPTMPDGSHSFQDDGTQKPGAVWGNRSFGVYLHQFHRGDDDIELHNHPWKWAVSLILVGGYVEMRRLRDSSVVVTRTIKQMRLNFIGQNDFHRVILHNGEAWTLFIAGPKVASWGFWNRSTGQFTHWREFINRKRRST